MIITKDYEMGGAGDTFEGEGNHTGFWWKKKKKREYVEELDVDGRIILKFIFMKWDGTM
jgi:hypothetical protein